MKITICGDFVPIARGVEAVRNKTALGGDVVNLLQQSDISIVNLECPVAEPNEACIIKNGPHLSTTPDTVKYLKECGVDAVTLANNHFYDHGRNGVQHTIDACNANDVQYVGGGLSKDEVSKILYIEKKGLKVAVLNYCESEFSVQTNEGSNPSNSVRAYDDIKEAKENNAVYIIVITHGGHEGYNLPSPRMKQLYRYFIDLGANSVINHHQHCFSGYEEYHGGTIFYGLGNFFFDDHRAKRNRSDIWNSGYMVSLELSRDTVIHEIIPYEQCQESAITQLLNEKRNMEFAETIEKINTIILDDSKLQQSFNGWCRKQKNVMLTWFSPYSNRILMALCRRGLLPMFLPSVKRMQILNTIRCESHRDVVLNLFQ